MAEPPTDPPPPPEPDADVGFVATVVLLWAGCVCGFFAVLLVSRLAPPAASLVGWGLAASAIALIVATYRRTTARGRALLARLVLGAAFGGVVYGACRTMIERR